MKILRFSSLLLGLLVVNICAGQNKKWTLQNCLNVAIENNLQVKQNSLQVQQQGINTQQSKLALLPTLNGTASQNWNGGGLSINPFTNQIVSNETFRSNVFGIGSGVTLYNGGQLTNSIKRNEWLKMASEEDLKNAELTIKLQVIQTFVNILSAKEQVKSAGLQVGVIKEQLDRTKKLVQAGTLPLANQTNIESQLATEELNLIQFENTLELTKLQLTQLMQIPADPNFDIEVPNLGSTNLLYTDRSPSDVYQIAESTQPIIKAANRRVSAANEGVKIAAAGYQPNLGLNMSYSTTYSELAQRSVFRGNRTVTSNLGNVEIPGAGEVPLIINSTQPVFEAEKIPFNTQLENNLSWRAGFTLNIPIFNGAQVRSSVANAEVNKQIAEVNSSQAKNQLRQTIEQAVLDAKLASKRYSATNNQYESLKENFRVTEQRFNAGAANSFDYNQARTNLIRAENDLIRNKYDLLLRIKVIDFYEGKELSL